ncbi:MAG: DUF4442 domain-containing protein [Chitinophagales bacterium]
MNVLVDFFWGNLDYWGNFGTGMGELNNKQVVFRRNVLHKWLFKLFMLQKMPIALLAGLRVRELDAEHAVASIPFKWLSQNPFKSVYFATQAMAAEMSTGVLGLMAIQGKSAPVSMLVTKLEAAYTKKAQARVYFTCENGKAIFDAVEKTLSDGEGVTVVCKSTGRLKDGTVVSNFIIEWSFKAKK